MRTKRCPYSFGITSMKSVCNDILLIIISTKSHISFSIYSTECSETFNGLCLRNGTDVLLSISLNTSLFDVTWDFVGLICLGIGMHILAFTGIRRFIHSAGYY